MTVDIGNIDGSIEAVQGGPDISGNGPSQSDGVGFGGDAVNGAEATGSWGGGAVFGGGGGTVDLSAGGVTLSSSQMSFTYGDAEALGGFAAIAGAAVASAGLSNAVIGAAGALALDHAAQGPVTKAIGDLAHDMALGLGVAVTANPSINLFDTTTAHDVGVTLAGSGDGSLISIWDPASGTATTFNLKAGGAMNVWQPDQQTWASATGNSEAGGL